MSNIEVLVPKMSDELYGDAEMLRVPTPRQSNDFMRTPETDVLRAGLYFGIEYVAATASMARTPDILRSYGIVPTEVDEAMIRTAADNDSARAMRIARGLDFLSPRDGKHPGAAGWFQREGTESWYGYMLVGAMSVTAAKKPIEL